MQQYSFGVSYTEEDVNKIAEGIETVVNIVDTVSTTEIPELKEEDEQILEVQETNLEAEKFEEQGDIAYNGSDKTPSVETGNYVGLTYYSQADKRWGNHQYSAIGDKTQTIQSSGCGPTCAAMIVSSIRGTMTPPEMRRFICKLWI